MEAAFDLASTEMDAISFYQKQGLLSKKQLYKNSNDRKLYVTNDDTIWRCNLKHCKKRCFCVLYALRTVGQTNKYLQNSTRNN